MKRNYKVYLDDILESIERIEEYMQDKDEVDFKRDIELQDAVLRRLEIIGEAVKHIPLNIKDKNQEIEWRKIAGARDIFIHEYFGIRLERIWFTVVKDIPQLKQQIKNLLQLSE